MRERHQFLEGRRELLLVGRKHVGNPQFCEEREAFVEGRAALIDDPDRVAMGGRGRRFVETWVSPAGVATAYGELFDELID